MLKLHLCFPLEVLPLPKNVALGKALDELDQNNVPVGTRQAKVILITFRTKKP